MMTLAALPGYEHLTSASSFVCCALVIPDLLMCFVCCALVIPDLLMCFVCCALVTPDLLMCFVCCALVIPNLLMSDACCNVLVGLKTHLGCALCISVSSLQLALGVGYCLFV